MLALYKSTQLQWKTYIESFRINTLAEKFASENTIRIVSLTPQVPETKIAEFANSVDLDEVAHDEPPHLDLHCLTSSL